MAQLEAISGNVIITKTDSNSRGARLAGATTFSQRLAPSTRQGGIGNRTMWTVRYERRDWTH